jgi:hypothetical protein
MDPFSGWENFYVIVGSSAGALTGLTFVAVTLTGEARTRGAGQGIPAYTTPTIVHFGVVLFVCAVLSAPWSDVLPPALILGLCGIAGVIYTLIVTRRLRRFNSSYTPVLEDWLANSAAPLVAYVALVVSAALLLWNAEAALFVAAGAMLLLIFDGIHNAWDVATYIVVAQLPRKEDDKATE